MESEIRVFSYPNGELQRVQLVRLPRWQDLSFLQLPGSREALDCFADIYRKYLVPACPWLFGNMIMFRLPEDVTVTFPATDSAWGAVADRHTAAAILFQGDVWFLRGKPRFRSKEAETLYRELERRDCLRLVRGRLPVTISIPVEDICGYLTDTSPEARLKVNASFFIMDRFDCATVYDHVGTPLGLCVKDGVITNPPLYGREALLVGYDGKVWIEAPRLEDLALEIRGEIFRPGKNARVYTRPKRSRTPRSKDKKLIIIGCRVAAVHTGGSAPIPASGFVLCVPPESLVQPGDSVIYQGLENVLFGIQVGNSIICNGEKTLSFRSRFYNIRHLEPVPYPPSLYPMNFDKARAARIALGADEMGKPMLLWAEGAGKNRYIPGEDSCGASLKEMADICADVGMVNAVNLDGGGSAQILVNNSRSLKISDRKKSDNSEEERPVPLALMIE